MKLANQIIFLGATSVSILFIVVAIILYIGFPGEQEKLLTQGGRSLVENLRLRINPMVLTDDRLSLNDALAATKYSDENIIYIFVLNKNKRPLASTYSKGVPRELIDFVSQRKEESTIKFIFEDIGSCLNISTPLFGGDLGSLHLGLNRDPVGMFAYKSILNLSITFAIISVVSMAIAVLIGRGVARPLNQIAIALKKGQGEWPELENINTGSTSEIQEFAAILKQMITRLQDAEQIRRDYEQKLITTERLASVGELASEVAHEINNPLDGLIEITRYLEKNADNPQKVQKYMPLLKDGLERIGKTGRQLLGFSRSDGTDFKEVFGLCEVINNTVALLDGSMRKRNMTVKILCKENYHVIGNAVAVGQAVMNLLLNAADALSPQGGKIDIEISSDADNVIITVTDDGPGISKQISEKIFEAFFSTKTSKGGTGLGLAVSRSLIRKCGGELFLAEAKVKGSGAKFVIKLINSGKKGICDVKENKVITFRR
ncbi:MAG: HAMP domain-containing histidine kinase [Planctomycetes bacterium]|nr:HAMP domain-containing histidine kinase [Planctomycetota bacterium]